jgi:hypothetical protein
MALLERHRMRDRCRSQLFLVYFGQRSGHMDLVKRYAEIVTLVKSRKPRAIPEIS